MLGACSPCKTMEGGQTIVDAGIFLAASFRARWAWGLLWKPVSFYQVHELRLTEDGGGRRRGGCDRRRGGMERE